MLILPTALAWEREGLYLLLAAARGHSGRSKTEVPGGSFVAAFQFAFWAGVAAGWPDLIPSHWLSLRAEYAFSR